MAADKMILGENAVYSTDSRKTGLNNNVVVCGGSGCGKTMSIIETRLLETVHSSLMIPVTKRRIIDKYRPVFEQRGYVVEVLDFVQPAESDSAYDPLVYLCSYSDIRFLAEAIVKASARKDASYDPYWDNAAISLLSAEIAYTLMTKERASFADVLALHREMTFEERGGQIYTSLDQEFERLEEIDRNCFAVSCYRSFSQLPIKTAGCVFGTLNTTLDTIFSPELCDLIRKEKKLDFEELAAKKTVLFILTSAVNPALHSFINMFYGQAFKTLFEYAESLPGGKLTRPVQILCDDFATGGRILNFPEYISIFREKQISVTLLLQSESQLASIYGHEDATTIINNCDTYLYMGGMDIKTARSVSERLNVPLDMVLTMPIGQEYIFRRGQKPMITERYPITENSKYQQITRDYEARFRERE